MYLSTSSLWQQQSRSTGAVALPTDGRTLSLEFANGRYSAAKVGSSLASCTLASLVTGAVTPTASGMLIGVADDVTVPLSPAVLAGSWFNATQGTFVVVASIAYVNDTFPRIFEMSDGTDSNRLMARYNTVSDIGGVVTSGGVDVELSNTPYTQTVKFALSYTTTGFKTCLNGGTVQSTAVALPALTVLQLGNRTTTKNRQLDGNISSFVYYPTQPSDATLQTLTT